MAGRTPGSSAIPPPPAGSSAATIKLHLDLQDAEKELNYFARQHQNMAGQQRSIDQRFGPYSANSVLNRQRTEARRQEAEEAKKVFLKVQEEYTRSQQPFIKRAGGMLHRLLWGEDVSNDHEADRAQRRLQNRISTAQAAMHKTLAFTSGLSSALAPLPGGSLLHTGVAAFSQGYGEGLYNEDGTAKKGLRGLLGGLAGGLKTSLPALLIQGLAQGVSGAVQGGREDEGLGYMLKRAAGGDVRAGSAAFSEATRSPLLKREAAGVLEGTLRAGGSAGGAGRQALRAQVTAGQGGTFNELLATTARVGANTTEQIDANAKRLWIDVMATGMTMGIQKSRLGEVIQGLGQLVGDVALGVKGSPDQALSVANFIGQKGGGFEGARGFQVSSQLNRFAKGETGPLGNALSLLQAGLGGGTGLVDAMKVQEKGLFAADAPDGRKTVQGLVQRVLDMTGGNKDAATLALKEASGLGVNASSNLIDLVQGGKFGEAEYGKMKEAAKTEEQKFYTDMRASLGLWQTIDKRLEGINSQLAQIFSSLGGPQFIITVLKVAYDSLLKLSGFIDWVKGTFGGGKGETPTGANPKKDLLGGLLGVPPPAWKANEKNIKWQEEWDKLAPTASRRADEVRRTTTRGVVSQERAVLNQGAKDERVVIHIMVDDGGIHRIVDTISGDQVKAAAPAQVRVPGPKR